MAILLVCQSAWALVIDRVVAVVNKEVVTQSEVEEAAQLQKKQIQEGSFSTEKELLNQIIEKKIELQWARKKGIRIEDQELKVALEDIKQRNGFQSDEAFKHALEKEGVTWEKYLQGLREELTLLKLINREVDSNLLVTDEELKEYYDAEKDHFLSPLRIRLGEILLTTSSSASPEQIEKIQKRAEEIELMLKKGEDFSVLAEEYGEGAERRVGGDMGYFRKGELSPSIEKIVFSLNVGEVSGVVRSPAGFHIFKVEEIKKASPQPFDLVRKKIEEEVIAKKREELRQKWLSDLWANAYVEIK
ncbi:MAG TPA: peptidyl-prolyl cis-trans isomerase [Nitrospiria bacterium]|nr:peptidyl-prolyl cis-trans isomerase [Nitrospiria bacterium]